MDSDNTEDASPTWVTGALVIKTDLETWPRIKEAVRLAGGTVVYQRVAPAGVRLLIVERQREEVVG